MEFYSAIKKNEILSLAGKWIEGENIILSEVSKFRRSMAFSSMWNIDQHKYSNVMKNRSC
jgi:hypothetical protein